MVTPKDLPPPSRVGAMVVSGGSSARMAGVDKTLVPLAGVPLIARTVGVFERSPQVGSIALMVARENQDAVEEIARRYGWTRVACVRPGGVRRQDTVRLGLEALPPECEWVLVHDGARPLLDPGMIAAGLAAAQPTGAAVAAVPAQDTVKVVDAEGLVMETPDRARLMQVQTPQVFRRELLERAHHEVSEDVTDDAAMVERLGTLVRVFSGSYTNIKITTPEDLAIAEALLAVPGREQA